MLNLNKHTCVAMSLLFCSVFAVRTASAQEEFQFSSDDSAALVINDETFTEPIEEIKVAAAEMGIVDKIHVKLGDQVEKGDLLVEMDMKVIEATRKVAASKASSTARLNASRVELEIKKTRYEKLVALVKEGAGSPEEVQRAFADVKVAQQNVEAILEENEQFKLEVEKYEAQKERRRTRSPIRGKIVDVRKQTGEFVSTNEPHIITVVQLEVLRATFHITTSKAKQLQKNDIVEVRLTETDETARATVEYVSPITKADSGRVRVDVLIDNQGGDYRSGVRCQLVGKTERQASLRNLLRND